MKHATISFGQQLSVEVLTEADRWCREAEVVLALGSSLTVSPAAELPRIAVACGAKLIIINRTPTPLDEIATDVIRDDLGKTLQSIDDELTGTGSSKPDP